MRAVVVRRRAPPSVAPPRRALHATMITSGRQRGARLRRRRKLIALRRNPVGESERETASRRDRPTDALTLALLDFTR